MKTKAFLILYKTEKLLSLIEVLATSDIAKKCGDNLVPMNRQPTKTGGKGATFFDSDNPLLISRERHFFAVIFLTETS